MPGTMPKNVLVKYMNAFRFPILLLLLFALLQPAHVTAQPTTMPAFKMLLTDGSFYTAADLPVGKPVVLIYFAPDCDHCQELIAAFFKKIDAVAEHHDQNPSFMCRFSNKSSCSIQHTA